MKTENLGALIIQSIVKESIEQGNNVSPQEIEKLIVVVKNKLQKQGVILSDYRDVKFQPITFEVTALGQTVDIPDKTYTDKDFTNLFGIMLGINKVSAISGSILKLDIDNKEVLDKNFYASLLHSVEASPNDKIFTFIKGDVSVQKLLSGYWKDGGLALHPYKVTLYLVLTR